MKKIISFIITICTVFNLCAYSVVANEAEIAVSPKVQDFLLGLNIVKPDELLDADKDISRGEFALYAARLMTEDLNNNSDQYFTDVPKDSKYYGAVSFLVKNGAVSAAEDKKFEADRSITVAEASKILVCVLGLKTYAEATGGYPNGYIKAAKRAGISLNLSGDSVKAADAYNMIYDANRADLYEVTAVNNSDVSYEKGGHTVLSRYRNIYKAEGVVTKTQYNSLTDFSAAAEGMFWLGDTAYFEGDLDMSAQIGQSIEMYYKKTDKDSRGTVVCYFSEAEKIRIEAENLEDFSDNKLSYYDEISGKRKYFSIGKDVPVIKNGRLVSEKRSETIKNLTYGYIELSLLNGKINVVNIKEEETLVMQAVDSGDMIIYGKNKEVIECGKGTENVLIIDNNTKKQISVDLIDNGSILTMYRSNDKKLVEIYVLKQAVTGTVTGIKESDGVVTIDNQEYKINRYMRDKGYLDLSVGMVGEFKIDINGAVCEFMSTANRNMYGYIYDSAIENNGFENKLKVKIFTATSEHKVYEFADSVNIDNVMYKSFNDVLNRLSESGDVGTIKQLVSYRLNSEGKINAIDTAAASEDLAESDGSLVATTKYTGQLTQYYWITNAQKSSFYPEPVMDRDTKLFIVPTETDTEADESNFLITDYTWFSKSFKAKMSAYKTDFSHPFAEVVVIRADRSQSLTVRDYPLMVDEEIEEINGDGVIQRVICGIQGTASVKIPIADYYKGNVPKLSRGDMIRVSKDYNGEVCDFEMLLDYSANKDGLHRPEWFGKMNITDNGKKLDGEYTYLGEVTNMTFGHIIKKWYNYNYSTHTVRADSPGLILKIGYGDKTQIDRTINCLNVGMVVFDTKRDKVYVGSEKDIEEYANTDGGTDAYIFTRYYAVDAIYLYKN